MACLDAVWVSKAAARQRKGRAGRLVHALHYFYVAETLDTAVYCGFRRHFLINTWYTIGSVDVIFIVFVTVIYALAPRVQAGHCFHVFTKLRHEKMAEFQLPEMLRTPLEELVLQIKILKLGMALEFLQKAIEPPEEKAVRNALQCLKDLVSAIACSLGS